MDALDRARPNLNDPGTPSQTRQRTAAPLGIRKARATFNATVAGDARSRRPSLSFGRQAGCLYALVTNDIICCSGSGCGIRRDSVSSPPALWTTIRLGLHAPACAYLFGARSGDHHLVFYRICSAWPRYARPLRSTSSIGRRGVVSIRTQPAIHRRGARPLGRGSLVRELFPARLCSIFHDRLSSFRPVVRGAHPHATFWRRLHSLLCGCSALVAQAQVDMFQQ